MTVELDFDDTLTGYWNPVEGPPKTNWNGHTLTGSLSLPKIAEKIPIPLPPPRLGYLSYNPLKREVVELKPKGEEIYENEGRVERASFQGTCKKIWKKHKKEILIGAGIAAAVVIVVVIVVATAGAAAAAGAGGSAVAGAAGAVTSTDKEKKAPPKEEPKPSQQEPSFGEKVKEVGAHLTHETWNGITEVASVFPQLNEETRDLGSKMIPEGVIRPDDSLSPMENYERVVAAGHQAIDRVFSTEQAVRYTPEVKENNPRNDLVIGVLPPPTVSSIKETAKIGQKVVRAAENLGNDRAMLDSFEKFKVAEEFLKLHRGQCLSEIEARELIHQTGVRTFPRPAGIPENFIIKLSKKGGGIIYENPENSSTSVRVMPGKPHSPNPHQQKPYVMQIIDGKALDKNGNLIHRKSEEAHIPIDEFIYKD